ncbi:MAG: thioredoxin family protein [Gammaproteobacteria bacterium]|nr:thioredoxin family protein [Gammaproteobacteria bacterium]
MESYVFATQLLLAVVAGAVLNLTPCVLPAIPVKLRMITAAVGAGPGPRWVAAGAVLAGTWTFFGGLALAAGGAAWNWGELFQSPAVRLGLALVLVVLGLMSMAARGFKVPERLYRLGGRGYAEPYLAGLLAALLSTPCTGPFLGGVLAFAVTRPPGHVMAIFLAIGLGLALPYLILLASPRLLARLPKSGPWSRRVHQALGLVLLAGGVFFAAPDLTPAITRLLWGALALTALGWALWVLWQGPDLRARAVPVVCAILLAPLVPLALDPGDGGPEDVLPWQPFSEAALATARADGRPVLVEFTADWCITCKVLERTVYRHPRTLATAREAGLVTLQVDLTAAIPALQARLLGWGGAGIPFAVVLDGEGEVVKRLPDMFQRDTLVAAIRAARG